MSTVIPNPHLTSALHKSKTKLLPLIVLMFALAMLDRSNVGFVKTFLQTNVGWLALSLVGVLGLILLATLRHKATPTVKMTKEYSHD